MDVAVNSGLLREPIEDVDEIVELLTPEDASGQRHIVTVDNHIR